MASVGTRQGGGGGLTGAPLANEIALLLQVALLLFIVTVVIGILNGTDAVDFTRRQLLTHVHAGTLGWITLCAMAGSLWLFGSGNFPESQQNSGRWLARLAMIAVPVYVLVFWTTTSEIRPLMGAVTAVVFFLFMGWVVQRIKMVDLTVPHLGILAAVASSAVGAVLGVLLGLQIATGDRFLPDGGEDAHPAMMVIGFLIPVGMALTEFGLRFGKPPLPVTTAGKLQIGLPFIGGLMVMTGLLLDIVPLIALSLPFEIIGIIIMLKRLWPDLTSVDWLGGAQERFSTFAAIYLPIDIIWVTYLIMRYEGDLDDAPIRYILALDHMLFVGVVTNAVFALMTIAASGKKELFAWADTVIVFLVSLPLAVFIIGLIADASVLKQIGTPIMGITILLAIAVFTLRLQGSRQAA